MAVTFGLVGLAAMLVWLWQSDRSHGVNAAQGAERCSLPVGALGARSHSWWATVVLVLVNASIFSAFAFAHMHVSMLATVCPPPGARLPEDAWVWGSIALTIAGAAVIGWLGRRNDPGAGSRLAFPK